MLTKQFADVPNLDTSGREQLRYIDIDQIDDDPNNFYEITGIDELASNIQLCGLQQPLRVRDAEGGRYTLVSGHRRRAALRKLVEDGHPAYKDAPCIEERGGEVSSAMQELRLIFANSDTRKMTSSETARQAERVEALLYQLKEEGVEFPGRMRDHVAEACKVSKTKLANLKVIQENLATEWTGLYGKGDLSESTALTLARQPVEYQAKIFKTKIEQSHKSVKNLNEWQARKLGEYLTKLGAMVCKTDDQPCANQEGKWAKLTAKDYSYASCDSTCCDKCLALSTCKNACPKLADKVQKLKTDAKAQKRHEAEIAAEAEKPIIQQITDIWARLGAARAAAGVSMEKIFEKTCMYASAEALSEFSKQERGEGITVTTDLPFGYNFYLEKVDSLCKIADLLGCSVDYLLCRADDPKPFPGEWKNALEDTPDEGRFLFVLDRFSDVQPSVYWHGDFMDATPKSIANKHLEKIDRWMYQPALPAGMAHSGQHLLEQMMSGAV